MNFIHYGHQWIDEKIQKGDVHVGDGVNKNEVRNIRKAFDNSMKTTEEWIKTARGIIDV